MVNLREIIEKEDWYDERIGGFGEDNWMISYKEDILYTRGKLKKIANKYGMRKPYKFKRRDFRWIKQDNCRKLIGKIILVDRDKNELITYDLIWRIYCNEMSEM
jgi:hypothetical protein